MALRNLAVGLAGAVLLAGAVGLASPSVAEAATPDVVEGIGFNVTPAQPYAGNPSASDWTGSFIVGGQQVWCIDFAFAAPDTHQQYTDGTSLDTKFGKPVNATIASEISYLLLRFGNTTSADDAAALAQLLHTWTASPDSPTDPNQQLASSNNFMQIAYNASYHLNKLPTAVVDEVTTMTDDASANHGPWTSSMTAPTADQIIGKAGDWTVNVLNTTSKEVASVPVNLTATDATLPNGSATQVMDTPAGGGPLSVAVTPTGPNPKVVATVDSPAAVPKVRIPVGSPDTQKVVTTGGTTTLTSTQTTTASTAPGQVTVTKLDANSKAPIAGAVLELTGPDKKNPALSQDGRPITGATGKPLVLTTDVNGQATVQNIHTPQTVCFVEVSPPPGFDQAFNPASPPTVCANLSAGQDVQLTLTDVPNKVPVAIPAGGPPTMTAMTSVLSRPAPMALILLGGLLVLAAGSSGLIVARRRRR